MSGNKFHIECGLQSSVIVGDLHILEDGRLTDGQGRTVDFRNTLIIITSNLGTADLSKPAPGFRRETDHKNESARMRASIES